MKNFLPGLVIIGLLDGCATSAVQIDVSTAEELPKEIAISYLQKVTSENPYPDVNIMCVYADNGFYTGKKTFRKYEDSYMSLYIFPNLTFKFFLVPDNEFFTNSCLAAYKKNVHEEKPDLFFNKIPTALKSLGVKVEPKE